MGKIKVHMNIDFTKFARYRTALDNGYKVLLEIRDGEVIYIENNYGLEVYKEDLYRMDFLQRGFVGKKVVKHLIMQKKIEEANKEKYKMQDILDNSEGRKIEADIKTNTFKVSDHYKKVDLILDFELVDIDTISIIDYSDDDKIIDISNLVCKKCRSIMFMFKHEVKGNKRIVGLDKFLENIESDYIAFIVDVDRNGYKGNENTWLNIDFGNNTIKAHTASIRNQSSIINVDIKVNVESDDILLKSVKYEGSIKTEELKLERVDIKANTSVERLYITDGAKGEIRNDKKIKGTNLDRIYNTMLDVYEENKKKEKSKLYFGAEYKKYNLIWRMKADEKKYSQKTFFIEKIGSEMIGNVKFRYIKEIDSDIPDKPIYDTGFLHESYYKG